MKQTLKVHFGGEKDETIRIGLVLGSEGALSRMAMPFKFYMGGPLGTGNQFISWIHIQDLTSMIRFVIEHQELTGPINATTPEPVRMREFSKVLGEVLYVKQTPASHCIKSVDSLSGRMEIGIVHKILCHIISCGKGVRLCLI